LSAKVAVKRCVFSLLRKTFRLFAVRTSAGSLFHVFYTASVHGTWSRGLCEERSDIEEPVNWRVMSWWRYVVFTVALHIAITYLLLLNEIL